ncbi:MAG TPA: hypothetical protein VFR94_13850 [Nitrososphaeraceae archaeon]|nr:hypothetical protein [Nitrososphaeraceae archaeon]
MQSIFVYVLGFNPTGTQLGGAVVFILLAFGLAVDLDYVIISAARHKKGI